MKRFRFRLEKLARLRATARDACRAELALAFAEQQRLECEQRAVEVELHVQRQHDRALRQSATLSPELLRQSEFRRAELAASHTQLLAAGAAVVTEIDQCQQRLAAAECEYQAVAKLRDRRLAEHKIETSREESKLVDEAAARLFRRVA